MATVAENMHGVGGVGAYIAKHWRGGFSLGFAYWINGVLVALVSVAVLYGIGTLIDANADSLSLNQMRAAVIGFTALMLVSPIWQFVGIWRSASAHVSRGGKQAWAIAAKLAVAAAVLRNLSELITFGREIAPLFT
ncbi:hypothetical protein [Plastoroseomonas arctica]|uniref:Uncharacterized protein n=1 Tax=Plastoroseomonas arctica TaxID=1509237 RepID=A0AAF1JY64_9PROT|nr:hypothetical protein [Plastoroseomonas arctica]MBR0656596.1 hypothetical protein [Plastoroseomonas arctica]